MPLDNRKVIELLLEETKKIEDRCDGYRDEIANGIAEIISYEREHAVSAINIQQRVNDKCNAIGIFLAGQRNK